jgi:hypothetical protein
MILYSFSFFSCLLLDAKVAELVARGLEFPLRLRNVITQGESQTTSGATQKQLRISERKKPPQHTKNTRRTT